MFENVCEAGQEGEPSTINLSVTADMSRQEVVEEVSLSSLLCIILSSVRHTGEGEAAGDGEQQDAAAGRLLQGQGQLLPALGGHRRRHEDEGRVRLLRLQGQHGVWGLWYTLQINISTNRFISSPER